MAMQSSVATTQASALPTEDVPEYGRVTTAGIVLSEAAHWIEEGAHVIRSSEFELIGEGDDLEEAVRDFVGHALDLVDYLKTEIERGEATEREVRVAGLLGARLGQAYRQVAAEQEELERQRDRFIAISWRRRHKRQRLNAWLSRRSSAYSQTSRD